MARLRATAPAAHRVLVRREHGGMLDRVGNRSTPSRPSKSAHASPSKIEIPLNLKQVKTIFGFSYRPHQKAKRGRQQSEIFKAVEAPSYDLTVFKIKWRNLTLKIYDK